MAPWPGTQAALIFPSCSCGRITGTLRVVSVDNNTSHPHEYFHNILMVFIHLADGAPAGWSQRCQALELGHWKATVYPVTGGSPNTDDKTEASDTRRVTLWGPLAHHVAGHLAQSLAHSRVKMLLLEAMQCVRMRGKQVRGSVLRGPWRLCLLRHKGWAVPV